MICRGTSCCPKHCTYLVLLRKRLFRRQPRYHPSFGIEYNEVHPIPVPIRYAWCQVCAMFPNVNLSTPLPPRAPFCFSKGRMYVGHFLRKAHVTVVAMVTISSSCTTTWYFLSMIPSGFLFHRTHPTPLPVLNPANESRLKTNHVNAARPSRVVQHDVVIYHPRRIEARAPRRKETRRT